MSSHDSRILPFVFVILSCDNKIHELIDGFSKKEFYSTKFAFRLLLNGKILTSYISGCPPDSELCDAAILKKLVDPMATRNPDCALRVSGHTVPPSSSKVVIGKVHTLLKTSEGILMFIGLIMVGILVGATGTFVFLTGRLPSWSSFETIIDHDEDGEDDVDETAEVRQSLQPSSNYFDSDDDDELSDEDEIDFVDAARRVDSLSTGL